jgi:predicted transport protein
MPTAFAVADHLDNREPVVRSTYEALLKAVKKLGPMKEEPKKTSIHFVRSTAFAGIATRQASIILTVKSAKDLKSPRVTKHEQASPNRWHIEVRLTSPRDVDREVTGWLKDAYELSG